MPKKFGFSTSQYQYCSKTRENSWCLCVFIVSHCVEKSNVPETVVSDLMLMLKQCLILSAIAPTIIRLGNNEAKVYMYLKAAVNLSQNRLLQINDDIIESGHGSDRMFLFVWICSVSVCVSMF